MSKVKQSLQSRSIPDLMQHANVVVAAMTDSEHFPSPNPSLAEVTAKTQQVQSSLNQRDELQRRLAMSNTELTALRGELSQLLTQLGQYVENSSGGDEAVIRSAGMDVRAESAPITAIERPGDLTASVGDDDGEVDLSWDSVRGAKSYELQASEDAASWQHAGISTRSKASVASLASGTKYWFRVRAIGSNAESPWSDPATSVAP